jgi:hypothetical protein
MVRLSKQTRDRSVSYKRPQRVGVKTGPRKEAREFNEHMNALTGAEAQGAFIPKLNK